MSQKHGKPINRRDFLSRGLIAGSSFFWAPSIESLLVRSVLAGENSCQPVTSGSGRIPFFCIDISGGGSIPGSNVMVGKQGGQGDFLNSYVGMGLPTSMRPQNAGQTNTELGLMFHSDSSILRGIKAVTSQSTRDRIDGACFCTASADDVGINQHNPTYWIAASGTRGMLAPLLGSNTTASGGFSTIPAASFDPALKPIVVNSPTDATSLVQAGALATLLSQDKALRIGTSIQRLSAAHLNKFRSSTLPDQVKALINCGLINANEIARSLSPNGINPLLDTDITAVFTNMANNDLERKAGTAAKLLFDGYVGAATMEFGGYDYHDGTRATGERKDEALGRIIGQIFEVAARRNQDAMIYLLTDGSISTSGGIDNSTDGRGKHNWDFDDGEKGTTVAFVFRANQTRTDSPLIRNNLRQIGWFKDTDKVAVDRNARVTSNDPAALAKAIVCNYLALHGEEGKAAQVMGAEPFPGAMDQYLAFQKIRG